MPLPHRSPLHGPRESSLLAFVLAAGIALGWLAAAAICLWGFCSGSSVSPLLAPSAVVLAASGIFQARCAAQHRFAQTPQRRRPLSPGVGTWQLLAAGSLVLYLLALAVGPVSGIGWAWLASVAAWQSLLMLSLTTSSQTAEAWRRWIETHRPRRLTWLVAAAVIGLIAGEAALRANRSFQQRAQAAPLELVAAKPESSLPPAEFGPFTLRLDRLPAVRLRVALLGEQGSDRTMRGISYHVQQLLPSAELVNLPARWDDTELTSSRLAAAIRQARPDVVLAILPACDDTVPAVPQRSLFDWRQFELTGLLRPAPRPAAATPESPADATSFEAYLAALSPQVSACRTPLDGAARSRWQRTCGALDRALAGCREAQVELVVAAVPAELQLNAALRKTLLRRSGLSAEQLDIELPQRQLADFAQQRSLAVVDLLPPLRLCAQPVYQRNTTQLNEPGNRAAAAAIGGWLESRFSDRLAAQLSDK